MSEVTVLTSETNPNSFEYHYGEAVVRVTNSQTGQEFSFSLGDLNLDLVRLPPDHPAVVRKGSSPDVIFRPGEEMAHYSPPYNLFVFGEINVLGRTFPLIFFEELAHSETFMAIVESIIQGQPLGEEFTILTEYVKRFISESLKPCLGKQPEDWPDFNQEPEVEEAFNLVFELVAKRLSYRTLNEWTRGDWSKIGFNIDLAKEDALLTLLSYATEERFLRYWGADFLDLPQFGSLTELNEQISQRLDYIRGLSPDEGHKFGIKENSPFADFLFT